MRVLAFATLDRLSARFALSCRSNENKETTMSTAAINRVEKLVSKLCEQQVEILDRLAGLEARLPESNAPSKTEVIKFLDGFRAFEELGEASFGAWIETCTTDQLNGALRTIQMREGGHARLLGQRLKDLGAAQSFEVPEEYRVETMECLGSCERSDASKLVELTSKYTDVDSVIKPITDFADRLDRDPVTQSLLRSIADDERSTLTCLFAACAEMNPA
jgi:hypothetical protein